MSPALNMMVRTLPVSFPARGDLHWLIIGQWALVVSYHNPVEYCLPQHSHRPHLLLRRCLRLVSPSPRSPVSPFPRFSQPHSSFVDSIRDSLLPRIQHRRRVFQQPKPLPHHNKAGGLKTISSGTRAGSIPLITRAKVAPSAPAPTHSMSQTRRKYISAEDWTQKAHQLSFHTRTSLMPRTGFPRQRPTQPLAIITIP